MKADLHNHLGKNGKNPGFDETIDLVYNNLGENSIFGICNCNCEVDDNRFENFADQKGGKYKRVWIDNMNILFVPEKKIYVFGAEEIITKQGHLVVAGIPYRKNIQTNPKKTLSLEDALKCADDLNGITIAAHPFGKAGLGDYLINHKKLLNYFNGWEVYNASAELAIPGVLPFNANEKADDFYLNHIRGYIGLDIGACAFTDGHSAQVIGRSYTYLNIENNLSVNSLRDAIREGGGYFLKKEPAKWDALKHAYNMATHKLLKAWA